MVDLGSLDKIPQLQKMTRQPVNSLMGLCRWVKAVKFNSWSVLLVLFRKDTCFLESAIYLSMWPDVLKILGNVHLARVCFSSNCFILKLFPEKPMSPIKPELLFSSTRLLR